MKKLLFASLLGLGFQAYALLPEDGAQHERMLSEIKGLRRQVEELQRKIDHKVCEAARFESAAQVRKAESQKAPAPMAAAPAA